MITSRPINPGRGGNMLDSTLSSHVIATVRIRSRVNNALRAGDYATIARWYVALDATPHIYLAETMQERSRASLADWMRGFVDALMRGPSEVAAPLAAAMDEVRT